MSTLLLQVLNAMLLGCAGEKGSTAVQVLNAALAGGAVPDTWAPNGSSVRLSLVLGAMHDHTCTSRDGMIMDTPCRITFDVKTYGSCRQQFMHTAPCPVTL